MFTRLFTDCRLRLNWPRAAAIGLIVLACGVAADETLLPPPPPRTMPEGLPLQSLLYQAAELALDSAQPAEELPNELFVRGITVRDGDLVHVEIVGLPDTPAIKPGWLERFGGEVESTWLHRTDAWIPVDQLIAAAQALPPGYFIERANVPGFDEVIGEGPGEMNSDSYINAGFDGDGLTIAVIDAGYENLTAARDNGDAPSTQNSTEINYTVLPFESVTTHGTGCVEAAFDHCPDARWRLYKIDTIADTGRAVDDAIDHGVDVITHSLSRYNQGWDDDSGDPCLIANRAASFGILFCTSAGNRAQKHWQGFFDGGGGDPDWHNFGPGDESIRIRVPDGFACTFYLSWDTGARVFDYDLYFYDSNMNLIGWSTNWGNTYEEYTFVNLSGFDQTIHLAVWRADGGVTEMEIFTHGFRVAGTGGAETWLEHIVSAGSTTSPSNATNPRVVSVGAVDWGDYASPPGTTGIIQGYSSRGPSNDGMLLPDLCGPTNTTGFTYPNGFGGTSCATPNVAGAACAFWSAYPPFHSGGIKYLFYEQALIFKDWGGSGAGNTYGHGGAFLTDYVADTTWVSRDYGNSGDNDWGPYYRVQAAHDAATAGGRLLFIRAGSYPEPATLTKQLRLEILDSAVVLGR